MTAFLVLGAIAGAAPAQTQHGVIPPGREPVVQALAKEQVPDGLALEAMAIRKTAIHIHYKDGAGPVAEVALLHPDEAPAGATLAGPFAIHCVTCPDALRPALVDGLRVGIARHADDWRWVAASDLGIGQVPGRWWALVAGAVMGLALVVTARRRA